jgi:uncharacterized protein YndB with AHSA1/START domain
LTGLEPIVRGVEVRASADRAFKAFTEEISSWWPYESHSWCGGGSAGLVFEPRAGGRYFERCSDGRELVIGRILAWDPPRRPAVTWRLPHWPGAAETEAEVRFTASSGVTLVELEHRGWERLESDGPGRWSGYEEGWTRPLSRYKEHLGAAGG